jgi:hypothetical protein
LAYTLSHCIKTILRLLSEKCCCQGSCRTNKKDGNGTENACGKSMFYYYSRIYLRHYFGRIHLLYLILFFIALIVFAIIQYGFEFSVMLGEPNILCIDNSYAEIKLRLGYISAGLCVLGLIGCLGVIPCRIRDLEGAQLLKCCALLVSSSFYESFRVRNDRGDAQGPENSQVNHEF